MHHTNGKARNKRRSSAISGESDQIHLAKIKRTEIREVLLNTSASGRHNLNSSISSIKSRRHDTKGKKKKKSNSHVPTH